MIFSSWYNIFAIHDDSCLLRGKGENILIYVIEIWSRIAFTEDMKPSMSAAHIFVHAINNASLVIEIQRWVTYHEFMYIYQHI